jgi:hypothetical protein
MSDRRFRPAPPKTPAGQRPAAQHTMGFPDSDLIPVIMEPQKMYDAFQDTARSGPLPFNLSKGSLPLYFPMNRKYLAEYSHNVTNPPDKKQAWELRAARQGPFAGALEEQHGKALVFDTAQPANSPTLEDRRGGQDYLGNFMTERRNFDGTVTRSSSAAPSRGRGCTTTLDSSASVGDRPWQSQGAQILTLSSETRRTSADTSPSNMSVDVGRDAFQGSRPATAATSLGNERVRSQTHNAHQFDPTPIGSHDKVLRDKRTDNFEVPEWHVCRSKTKGFPYWYNRKTGESRWLPPEANVESKSAHVTAHETRISRSHPNANDRNYFRHDSRRFAVLCAHVARHANTARETVRQLSSLCT